jgi:acetyltransferase-like isoleucine patch superfamily enzyme
MTATSIIQTLRRYGRENGMLLLMFYLVEAVRSRAMGWLLGRWLGNSIRIGRGAQISGLSRIRVGKGFRAGRYLWLEAVTHYGGVSYTPEIVIKNDVSVSDFVHIAAADYVEIGDGVLIGSKVLITDHNHGLYSGHLQSSPELRPVERPLTSGEKTIIGDNVWLGDNVVVLPGVIVAQGSIIGANSVVASSIPQDSLAVGIPARVVKHYCSRENRWIPVMGENGVAG